MYLDADYRCQTPLFTEVCAQFLSFLEEGGGETLGLPPWALELAHYEWVEAALLLSDICEPAYNAGGDLFDGVPVLSPQAWPLAYQWPVSEIGPDYLPGQAPEQPTLLLARRGSDLQVHFPRLASLAHALLTSLQARECSGREHLQALAEAIGVDSAEILAQGLDLLENLQEQGVVLGTRN